MLKSETEEKLSKQIQEPQTLLDNILRHSANGISVTRVIRDAEGVVIDGRTIIANDAAIRYTGIPRDIYLGKRATEIDPNITSSEYFQLCVKTLETGEPQFNQYYLDVTNRWLEISISRMDEDHLITIFTDITQVKEAQIRQQQLVEELKRTNLNLEEFVYAASHDLKEPIRKIHFFSEQLKSRIAKQPHEDHSRLVQRIEKAAKRMGVLVDDLLEYSHVSRGLEKYEAIELNSKLQLVIEELELTIQEKRAHLEIGVLPTIKGNRRQMQQLFQNLISNALKYSRTDIRPNISITSRKISAKEVKSQLSSFDQDKTYYLIEVQDNGIGFEQKEAERIFNVFTRLHGNAEYMGNGVGLSIARKVAENHGGLIWAESKPGNGATFKIILPEG